MKIHSVNRTYSERYRNEAKEKVKEVMMQEPLVSLTSLADKAGYSKPFLACIYLSVRKSNEWRTWCKEFHAENK